MNSPSSSPRARRRSPTTVQDTSPRRRRNRCDKNQQQQQQQLQQQQLQQQQQQQRRFPKLPPYHVLDVFGERGLFLIDGDVPVESLARMGLVLPLPWMPVPGAPAASPPPTTPSASSKSNRKQSTPMKTKSTKLAKPNGNSTPNASLTLPLESLSVRPRPTTSPLAKGSISKNESLVHNVMAVSPMRPRQVLSQ